MLFKEIHISDFRNLDSVRLCLPEKGYCVISGPNGSGKTSLLEAIYMLSCGKSFRTGDSEQLLQHDKEAFTLFANLYPDNATLGLRRDRQGKVFLKLMGDPSTFSDIARLLPIRVISPVEAYSLINGGPDQRRRFLNWGMFHVKHFYWAELQKLNRIIKQKSAALKMRCSNDELTQWNHMLTEVSYSLDSMRCEYIQKLNEIVDNYREKLPILGSFKLTYASGWAKESTDLFTQLSTVMARERMQGHCLLGPHRADILFEVDRGYCKDQFSRGQQKLLTIALYLSQGELLYREMGRHPLYMIDDFSSELDKEAQCLLIDNLDPSNKQVIITTLDKSGSVLSNTHNQASSLYYSIHSGNADLISKV